MRFAFYKGRQGGIRGLFDWIVRAWMRGPYSHVEAVVGMNGDLCHIASSLPGAGVRIAYNQIMSPKQWDFFDGPGDEATALAWFRQHDGARYNYLGLFGFLLRPVEGEKGAYFCSEACCYAAGISDPWRFDPNALADLVRADTAAVSK
ncbi:hypothetical protein [Paraburkholderia kururiensis]|uniref:hypothetical protein n=1 Tax=Paraburkholderia kururiensis TaxID=984307 RepID=UPI00034513A7|nr:hypothetical protein [Paraburkholderia kururiensis]